MESLREEFKELLKRSGWNQSEAARNLDLPAGSVSRYVNDIDMPSKQTIRLFKMMLADTSSSVMHDRSRPEAHEGEELWRKRAKTAEKELADLRSGLRALLEGGASSARAHTARTDHKKIPMGELGKALDRLNPPPVGKHTE